VRIAPPETRVEVVPARPSPHHFWVHGYWAWNGHRHVWAPGHYEVERHGYVYRETRWEEGPHGHWRYHHGGWDRR
jgi:WXXGXW repeat (2 copies)